ncbi:MAG TPA: hypothetical protein PLS50_09570 [Candidatus Dojkabacteria bacterium]|nr:hypothetical protein [Candidatus Dojkabacteria bacterium]
MKLTQYVFSLNLDGQQFKKLINDVFSFLQDSGVDIYHGQRTNRFREKSHKDFVQDKVRVVVATLVFLLLEFIYLEWGKISQM